MNDADRKAFEDWWPTKPHRNKYDSAHPVTLAAQEAWQAACKWRDSQNTLWRNAAIRVGEDLHSVGPNGYYNMSAEEWLNWALNTIYSKSNSALPAAQINQQLMEALQYAKRFLNSKDHDIEYIEATLAAAKETK